MSLFPSRLKPGGTVTIHVRSAVKRPTWMHLKVFVVAPDGERTLCLDRLRPFLPTFKPGDTPNSDSSGPFQSTPLLMAAQYLQSEKYSADFFAQALKGLRDSHHQYVTYSLPADAKLGKYRSEIEASVDGKVKGSGTVATDCFFVETLIKREVSGGSAKIENPSPEPVPALLCELLSTEEAEGSKYRTRKISLPPHSTTQLEFEGTAFLNYSAGTEFLRLNSSDDPVCLRNPSVASLPRSEGQVFLFEPNGQAYQLTEGEAEVWRLANGFRPRSQVRGERLGTSYDKLLGAGLILETEMGKE